MSDSTPRFATLLADPPWNIQQRDGQSRGADAHYRLVTVEVIASLPVAPTATESARLLLWLAGGNEVDSDVGL